MSEDGVDFDSAALPGYEALGSTSPPLDNGHGTCKKFLTSDARDLPADFYPPEVVGELWLSCKTPAGEPVDVYLDEYSTDAAAAKNAVRPELPDLGGGGQQIQNPTEDAAVADLPAGSHCFVGSIFVPPGMTTTNRRCLVSVGRYTVYADVPIDADYSSDATPIQRNLRLFDRQDPEHGLLDGVEWLKVSVPAPTG
jgi:hypothetical protein